MHLVFLFVIIALLVFSVALFNSFKSFVIGLITMLIGGAIGFAVDEAAGGSGVFGLMVGVVIGFVGAADNKKAQEKSAAVGGRVFAVFLLAGLGVSVGSMFSDNWAIFGGVMGFLMAVVSWVSESEKKKP